MFLNGKQCLPEEIQEFTFKWDQLMEFDELFCIPSTVEFHQHDPDPVLSASSPAVPGYIRTRFVLLLSGGRLLPAQPELWNHPKAGVPRPSDCWKLHEEICQGDFSSHPTGFYSFFGIHTHLNLSRVSLRPLVMSCCLTRTSSQKIFQIMSRKRKWWVVFELKCREVDLLLGIEF